MNNEERARRLIREIPGIAAFDAKEVELSLVPPPLTRAEKSTIMERLERLPWNWSGYAADKDGLTYSVAGKDLPEELRGLESLRTEKYDYELQLCGTVLFRIERKKEVVKE